MGIYGYCGIQLTFEETATKEEIEAFFKEIKENEELSISNESEDYFEIHSGRLQNLKYQCEKVNEILKKHSCVLEGSFSAYSEYDIGLYYEKEVEENDC